ncbi:MAG TPA: sugar phosphate nucleotidyltransferase [Thermoanaerobaculia bacterium]|jgi:mannose-1-phosphate guanylyltransferase|nr:sugar phosphate nucleotidyltransferase [Thermoanaerobaculia bacterium]
MQALILAGGSGTRFWPLSRRARPKQLLALEGGATLLQRTVARLAPLVGPRDVWVCTTAALADGVAHQLPEVPRAQVLAEPEGRNTAPAIAWAVTAMPPARRSEPVAVLPADHRIGDDAGFRRALETAGATAADGTVLALGVRPRWAETGYGYLELGEVLDARTGLQRVVRFVEKPDRARAEGFVAGGRYLWNGGIFAFRGDRLLALVERHLPALAAGLAAIAREPRRLAELYRSLPAISIDHGVMEKLDDLATLPLDCGWSDLGSWEALAEVLPRDRDGNSTHGDVVAVSCRDSLLWAEEGTMAVAGLEGMVVVRTGDAVLVMPKSRSQEVREVVDRLRDEGREDLL